MKTYVTLAVEKYTGRKVFIEMEYHTKKEFINANFKTKRSGCVQHINRVEVIEHGTAVYFWCGHMCNFVIYGGSKRGTYEKLYELLIHICFEENKDYINISDFIVKR